MSWGYKTLPENEAVTENPCKWRYPKGPMAEPNRTVKMSFGNTECNIVK